MKMRVQVVIESAVGDLADVHEIACIHREELRPDTVGRTLDEATTVLERLQHRIVEQQAAEYLQTQRYCSHCGTKRYHKGAHTVRLHTLFGKLRLKSPRFYHCQCQPHLTRTFSSLAERLQERSTPELRYLETKWASLMSYGMTTKLLDEVLPIGKQVNAATVRNHLHAVAERTEAELGEEQVFLVVLSRECSPKNMRQESSADAVCWRVVFARQHYVDTTTDGDMVQLLGQSQATKSCTDNGDVWCITHERFSLSHYESSPRAHGPAERMTATSKNLGCPV